MTTTEIALLIIQTVLILGGYLLLTKLDKIIRILTEIERQEPEGEK